MTTSIVPATAADLIKAAPLTIQKKALYNKLFGAGTKVDAAVAQYVQTDDGLKQVPTPMKSLQLYVTNVDVVALGEDENYQEKLNVWGHPVVKDDDGNTQPGEEVWCYTTGLSTVPARTIIGALLEHDREDPVHFEFELCKGTFAYIKTKVYNALTSQSLFNKQHFDACNAVKIDHPYPENASRGQRSDVDDQRKAALIELQKQAIEQIFPNA